MDQKDNSTDGEWKIIKAAEEQQKLFHASIQKKKDDQIDVKGAIECKTYEEFAIYWAEVAGNAETRLNHGRKKGWRKWSKKYQSFSKGVDDFMRDFSPIVDVVKGAFPPYGGIAIGTISALFVVAQQKEAMEGHLSTAIAGIKDRLPGFQMYREIYNKDSVLETDLRRKIVSVYAAFVDLSIEATTFYSEPGYYRWAAAMVQPKKFKEKADEVQDAVVKIKLRCEELLSQNVDKIKKLNIDLKEQVSDLKGQVEKLQLHNDHAHLVQLQKGLGLGEWSSQQQKEELEAYRKALERSHRDDEMSEFLEQMTGARLQKFKESDAYKSWKAPTLSQIFILVGKNNENASESTRHCWASRIALSEIDHLEKLSAPFAYYTLPVMKRSSLYQVIPTILLQLLRLKLKAMGPSARQEDLYSKIRAYEAIAATEDMEEEKILSLHQVVASVINYFEAEETVYVIVDRVDRCEEDQQLSLLQALVQLMENGRCTAKVLVIANKSGWSIDKNARLTKAKDRILWLEQEQKVIED